MGKIKNKEARKGNVARNLVRKLSNTAGEMRGFTEGLANTTLREERLNSRGTFKKKLTQKSDLASEAQGIGG